MAAVLEGGWEIKAELDIKLTAYRFHVIFCQAV
jgi:hypothetical protein